MAKYYSFQTRGFYDDEDRLAYDKYGTWPEDARPISGDEYLLLLAAATDGKTIATAEDGGFLILDPPPPGAEWVRMQRQAAYRSETDPLKFEAEYDAMIAGTTPDYSVWIAKVAEIKGRYPLPE